MFAVVKTRIGQPQFTVPFDVDLVGSIHHDFGDSVVVNKRLDWAVAYLHPFNLSPSRIKWTLYFQGSTIAQGVKTAWKRMTFLSNHR